MKKIILVLLVGITIGSCASTKNGCPNDVQRWERKNKFIAVVDRVDGRMMYARGCYGMRYKAISECFPALYKVGDTVDATLWTRIKRTTL